MQANYLQTRKLKRYITRETLLLLEFDKDCPNVSYNDIEQVEVSELIKLQIILKKIIKLKQKKTELIEQGINIQ
jgi:hypothetical protein